MAATTAILLIDVQNEFTTPGGKLHDKVKNVMKKTGLMVNLPPFVEKMRRKGATIIYSPAICGKSTASKDDGSLEEHAFGNFDFPVFQEGSWSVDFPPEISPKEKDIVLSGRSNFSSFEGTNLESIIQQKKIRKLYVAGFLTNFCILETVHDAAELGLIDGKVQLFVLKDCCAAETIEEHNHAIDVSLSFFCETVTSRQALDDMALALQQKASETPREDIEVPHQLSETFEYPDVEGSEEGIDERKSLTVRYKPKRIRSTNKIIRFLIQQKELIMWGDHLKFILLSLLLQFLVGNFAFKDDTSPACIPDESYTPGGINYDICSLAKILKENYTSLRTLVAFILGGFISHSVYLWRTRRTNYCQVCGANRNLILQISSLLPIPSNPEDNRYAEICQERATMERWAILGYELAILKGKGTIDASVGRAHIESLGLLLADEWDKMVVGDRHTTVWYWIQQKAVYLTEAGIITSEQRLQTICKAVTVMRDKANDLMSVIDRDNPHAYTFVVGILVNLNLLCLSLYKGIEWAIWYHDSNGLIYKSVTMYTDLFFTLAIVVTFTMLYDVAIVLYNPFHERPNTDDVPHSVVGSGIRHLAESLGEAKNTRPSTMFWMSSQNQLRTKLGLRYKRPMGRRQKPNLFRTRMSEESFEEYIKFTEASGKERNSLKAFNR